MNAKYLTAKFGLSTEAAEFKLKAVRQSMYSKEKLSDEELLLKFEKFLKKETYNYINTYLDERIDYRKYWRLK